MSEIFIPYTKILGYDLEVQFAENPVKNIQEQKKKGIEAFIVYAADPANQDVWVHEFTEWALDEVIERIINKKKNVGAIAHVMASFHTVSGVDKNVPVLQTPERFARFLHLSKYKCLIYHPKPQKRLDRYFFRKDGGQMDGDAE